MPISAKVIKPEVYQVCTKRHEETIIRNDMRDCMSCAVLTFFYLSYALGKKCVSEYHNV